MESLPASFCQEGRLHWPLALDSVLVTFSFSSWTCVFSKSQTRTVLSSSLHVGLEYAVPSKRMTNMNWPFLSHWCFLGMQGLNGDVCSPAKRFSKLATRRTAPFMCHWSFHNLHIPRWKGILHILGYKFGTAEATWHVLVYWGRAPKSSPLCKEPIV